MTMHHGQDMTIAESRRFSEDDLHLFNEGTHFRLFDKLGAHPIEVNGGTGTHFSVWAPNAESVSVVGNFNDWDSKRHALQPSGLPQGPDRPVNREVRLLQVRSQLRDREVRVVG